MSLYDDYYSILQVHFLAEPEVIEGAYKKLAKKYHPDVNKTINSEIKMKKINEAYEILKDTEKRKKYDAQSSFKQYNSASEKNNQSKGTNKDATKETPRETNVFAKITLKNYFECIKTKDFIKAYELLSEPDKNKISLQEFVKWQTGVSKVYELRNFHLTSSKTENDIILNNTIFEQAIEFIVSTEEHNTIMGRLENDIIDKMVVKEKANWHVFLGYDDVKPYINRFEILSGLLLEKSAINEIVNLTSNKDHATGLLSKKGLIEAVEKEVLRHERYGNRFSLMLIKIDCCKNIFRNIDNEIINYSVDWASEILKKSLRNLDLIGRWDETEFLVLMSETHFNNSIKAALKIKRKFETNKLYYNGIHYKTEISIGIDEFRGSLENTIGRLSHYISIANKHKGNNVISSFGVHK